MPELPDVRFGDKPPMNWRKIEDERDPDDEELDETPKDVTDLLGFDPKRIATTDAAGSFYTVEQLGPQRRKTPEGYTICVGVPIARTGDQLYTAGEIGLPGDPKKVIRVQRLPEDVFRPETIASFEGKDCLLDHPADGKLVSPQTWRDLTCGGVQNCRQGEGDQDNLLLADLVVKDPKAIEAVDKVGPGSRIEVSAGYDADYEDMGDGVARQHNITGNHVALLLDARGRCGPVCAVGDRDSLTEERPMRTATVDSRSVPVRGRVRRFMDRAIRALSTNDSEELHRLREEADELPDELRDEGRVERHEIPHEHRREEPAEDAGTHVHIHHHDEEAVPERDDEKGESTGDRGRGRGRGRDQEMAPPEGGGGEGGPEPDGDEPATKGDIVQLMDLICELLGADEEGDDLNEEEANGGEVADRRLHVRDRRRAARDAFRAFHKKVHDEVGEIVETKPDKESTGKSDLPGTEGSGKEGISTVSVHDRGRRSTRDRATVDSTGLKDTWDLVASRAEILSPGIMLTEGGRTITFDAAVSAELTDRRLCALRRRTLDAAYRSSEGREIIDMVTAGTVLNLKTAPCASIEPVFNAASAMRAERNRRAFSATPTHDGTRTNAAPLAMGASIADLNKANRDRYKAPAIR